MRLEQRIRDVLAEASILAEASASAPDKAKVSHGKAEDSVPSSAGTSTYDSIRRRIEGCVSDGERLRAVEEAERLVARSKRQKPQELSKKQTDYWILVNSQGRDYRDVAAEFGVRETTIYKMRLDNGYEPRKGRPKAA